MSFFGFLWPRYFGRRHLGSIQGTGQMLLMIGASIGPLPFGLAYDLSGSFAGALLVSALLPLGVRHSCIIASATRPAGSIGVTRSPTNTGEVSQETLGHSRWSPCKEGIPVY